MRSDRRRERSDRDRGRRARAHLDRRRQQRELRRPRRLPRLAVFGAALGLGLIFGAWVGAPPAPIEAIAVAGNARIPTSDVAAAAGVERGEELGAAVLLRAIAGIRANPWIRSVRALALPGGVLLVRVEERQPHALLTPASGDGAVLVVDASGAPFAPAGATSPTSLLRLRASAPLPQQSEPHPDLVEALALGARIRSAGIGGFDVALPVAEAPEGWILVARDDSLEVILGREPGDGRVARLARILTEKPEEIRGARRLDLRFADHAVVVRGEEPASG